MEGSGVGDCGGGQEVTPPRRKGRQLTTMKQTLGKLSIRVEQTEGWGAGGMQEEKEQDK